MGGGIFLLSDFTAKLLARSNLNNIRSWAGETLIPNLPEGGGHQRKRGPQKKQ